MTGTTGISDIVIRFALIALATLIILLGLVVFSMPLPFGAADSGRVRAAGFGQRHGRAGLAAAAHALSALQRSLRQH